ncbi:hypothetical protein ACLESD_46565 [Pyxidicoccus sp. 3LFB2]
MKTVAVNSASAVVELSWEEILGLLGAIHELQWALKSSEISVRTGVDVDAHRRLWSELRVLFHSMKETAG